MTAQAAGCDVNAAYDPDRPCATLTVASATPVALTPVAVAPATGCDANAAYDPDHAVRQPRHRLPRPRSTSPAPAIGADGAVSSRPVHQAAGWAIQVGAFANAGLARAVAEGARAEAPGPLHAAILALPPTTPFGGAVLYRARLADLSAGAAADACSQLNRRQLPCVVVPPAGP